METPFCIPCVIRLYLDIGAGTCWSTRDFCTVFFGFAVVRKQMSIATTSIGCLHGVLCTYQWQAPPTSVRA